MKKAKRARRILRQPKRELIALTDIDALKGAGLPFKSVDAARWGYRRRSEHGTETAFIRIGGWRIFIDPELYHAAVRRESTPAQGVR